MMDFAPLVEAVMAEQARVNGKPVYIWIWITPRGISGWAMDAVPDSHPQMPHFVSRVDRRA
jgi:hypothetical protein